MVKHNLLDPKHWKESKDIENPIVKHFVEKNPDSKLMKNRGTIMSHKFANLKVTYAQIGDRIMNGCNFADVVEEFFQPYNIPTCDAIKIITKNGKNKYALKAEKSGYKKIHDKLYIRKSSYYQYLFWIQKAINVNWVKTPCHINVTTHDNGLDPMDYYLENNRYLT
tara:strand:+ start:338 stop:835 length:498 start_codon:yes stop_codon:yes gene_type:complete